MTTDGPALRRFEQDKALVEANPLAAWLATELPDASGGIMPDPFEEIVDDVEIEGNTRLVGVRCPARHGEYRTCPTCGAAL